jgi:hypothetical protein
MEGSAVASTAQTVADAADNVSLPSNVVTVKIDKTSPTLAPVVSPNPVSLNGTASVTSGATDAGSGLASQSCGALDTSSVGTKTVTCTATDNAGNTATANATYTVTATYNFSGFFQPVDDPGPGPSYVFNKVKAGSAIPIKFSLGGNLGLDVLASGSPTVGLVSCSTVGAEDAIEQTVTAGGSSLSYDPLTDQYTYTWKTDKAWANSCRRLTVTLADGTSHIAYFKFIK